MICGGTSGLSMGAGCCDGGPCGSGMGLRLLALAPELGLRLSARAPELRRPLPALAQELGLRLAALALLIVAAPPDI